MREPTPRALRSSRLPVLAPLALAVLLTTARAAAGEPGAPPAGRAAPRVSFDEAVQRAMARNPTSQLAAEDVRRAEALVQQARAAWLPTLTANATYTRLDADRVLGDRVIQAADSLNANLSLVAPLVSPRAWAATTRAKDSRDVARLTEAETRRAVALSAGRAYLTVIAQRRVLASSEQARETARAHEEFSRSRLAGGVGNRLDAVRAAQERATSETRVELQRLSLARAQEALGILVGESGPVDAADAELDAPPPTLPDALGDAEQKRADVRAARSRVEAARRAVGDAYVDYLPVLSGVVQPFYQTPATLTLPTTGWQAQVLFSLPLFDGGNRYGVAHERCALLEQARQRVEGALRAARSEVRIAFEAVERTDQALLQAREAAALAQESLGLTQLAYRAGATSNIEVVDAERRARDAEIEAAVAEDSSRQARLDLLAAAGRFPVETAAPR